MADTAETSPSTLNELRSLKNPSAFLSQQGISRTSLNSSSHPEKYFRQVLPQLVTSDHSLVSVRTDKKSKEFTEMPFRRTICRYMKAGRDSLKCQKPPSQPSFKHTASKKQKRNKTKTVSRLRMDPLPNEEYNIPEKMSAKIE